MSADDWIPCPFCAKDFNDLIESLKTRLEVEYERMTAKEYDEFKKKVRNKIAVVQLEKEEKSNLRIDGTRNYGFDDDGNFTIYIGASCPHCNRGWSIGGLAEPKFENGGK